MVEIEELASKKVQTNYWLMYTFIKGSPDCLGCLEHVLEVGAAGPHGHHDVTGQLVNGPRLVVGAALVTREDRDHYFLFDLDR